MLPYNRKLKQPAGQLRKNMTDAERQLWAKIRMKQLKGHQFYRQKPIGGYIVDFFCPGAKLVIEVDGSQHFTDEKAEYDRIRDEYLSSLGLRVLRFSNSDVMAHIEGVVKRIEETATSPFTKEGNIIASPFGKGRMRGISTGTKGVR